MKTCNNSKRKSMVTTKCLDASSAPISFLLKHQLSILKLQNEKPSFCSYLAT